MIDVAPSKIRVLLIDDDEDEFVIIKGMLAKNEDIDFQLDWCGAYDEAKDRIADKQHDAYLVDYRLGERSGLELLEQAQPEQRNEPFILLTGVGDRKLAWRSLNLAAADYLVKGTFNEELLARTLLYAVQRKRMEEQRLQYLVELNRSKDEFISIASHQLRTPATSVKQYLGMLLEGFFGELSDQQRSLVDKAYQSNERQLRIVTDLLKVAQVDAGKLSLHKTKVDLGRMVEDVVADQHDSFKQRKQEIVFESVDKPVTAPADYETLRMVLDNLIDNASKYSESHTTVTVRVYEQGDMACIDVRDEGVGISEAGRARLFEKFSRLENPLSNRVSGTGLGLYWVKKVLDHHGGLIDLESTEGEGSCFRVCLPKA